MVPIELLSRLPNALQEINRKIAAQNFIWLELQISLELTNSDFSPAHLGPLSLSEKKSQVHLRAIWYENSPNWDSREHKNKFLGYYLVVFAVTKHLLHNFRRPQ